jgi:membrane-bound lytic murein transglycosylase D
MYNKRFLLLGMTIIGTSWIYPDNGEISVTPGAASASIAFNIPPADTNRTVGTASTNPFFTELFTAASIGGSNGVRLNPKALDFVQDYLKENWDELQSLRGWGKPYFSLIEKVLTEYGLPKELKYLAVIESNLKSSAVSKVGAKGPWQLMPQTARDLGLKVNQDVDERKNYYKSTKAAAAYLRDLYNELGDWLLVIAAYNTGTANVHHAINRSGSHNFWDLQYYLPMESRNHVKRFIGTQYAFEGQGSVTTLTKDEAMEQLSGSAMYIFHRDLTDAEVSHARTIQVSGKYLSSVIAKYTFMDSAIFNRYNPAFDKIMASANDSYDLKLPADKMELFLANKYDILSESVQLMATKDDSVAGITGR